MGKFYVYSWSDEAGVVRYIGKGSGSRATDHLADARAYNERGKKTRSRFVRLLAASLRQGQAFTHDVLCDGLGEEEAYALEITLISEHKRLEEGGTLYNLDVGGSGLSSQRAKELWADPEKRALYMAGWVSGEDRARRTAHLRSEEYKRATSERMKALWADEGWAADKKAKLRERNKAVRGSLTKKLREDAEFEKAFSEKVKEGFAAMSPEKRAAMLKNKSESIRAAFAKPEVKARLRAATKEANNRPHRIEQQRAKALTEWQQSERREAAARRAQELWADPEWSAKRRAELAARNKAGAGKKNPTLQRLWATEEFRKKISERMSEVNAERRSNKTKNKSSIEELERAAQ